MSNVTAVTDQNWESEVLGADRPVLVDFWAEWCGPCRQLGPIVEEVADEMTGTLKVVSLNVDDNQGTARAYQVMSIPTLLVFADGEEKKRIVGSRPKSQLLREVGEFLPA